MSDLPESLPRDEREEARREAEFEDTLHDALDETPRAHELRELRDVLKRRRSTLQRELDEEQGHEERELLQGKLDELDQQIGVLDEEAGINQFVEDTIKFSHEVRRLSEG